MRVVSFKQEQHDQLLQFNESRTSIAMTNCEVKRARQSEELEMVLKSASKLEGSPKKFDVDISAIGRSVISLDELQEKSTFDKVTVSVKVTQVEKPVKVSGGLQSRV